MINISKSNFKSIFGKFLRMPLKLIPLQMVLPIMQGKLKGKKWIKGSSINGCWLGTYEFDKQILFEKEIKQGMIVYDVGANVGFYSLLSSVLTGIKGKVYSFEPFPSNIEYLKRHIELNKLNNVFVVDKAVSDRFVRLKFSIGENNSVGHLSSKGELEVMTITIDEFVKQGNPLPDLIKMDIEGAEFDALNGAKEILQNKKPIIFFATHGDKVKENCIKLLKKFEYSIESIENKTIEEADEFICK